MSIIEENPFPGLRSFSSKESHLFFGREQHIHDLLFKLNEHHFVAIVGTSGSGKSSLVHAGLLPAIRGGKLDRESEWILTSMSPGNTPISNLAKSLIHKDLLAHRDIKEIYQTLSASPLGLVQLLRTYINEQRKLLIYLDQFEEIFRFASENDEHRSEEATQFVNLIVNAIRQRDIPIYVVLTVRSDFLGDCARFEGLPEAINDGHYLVPRLNKEQNKLAITGPIDYSKGKISPKLVQRVVNDLGDNPDQLPVLQHALMRTWDKWVESGVLGEPMDIKHYEEIGTMRYALSNHADEAFEELKTNERKRLAEQIFKILTVKTGDNRGVRRPSTVHQLMAITQASLQEVHEVLLPFRKKGRTFILPAGDQLISEATVMDISHESLMRVWARLDHWVDEEMDSAVLYERLCTSALLYKEGKAALWRDPELQLALDWKNKNKPNSAWAQLYNFHFDECNSFLIASEAERKNQTRSATRRKVLVRSAVVGFLIVVSILSGWALFKTKEANNNREEAEQKTRDALNQKQLAESAKEMALKASRQAMDAKTFADLQSSIAVEQKKMAEQQKTIAEQETYNANIQQKRAEQQKVLADEQKRLADQKRLEALREKQKADSAQSEANHLRLLSLSQNIAFKSLQIKDDPQLAALLAYEAYRMAKANNGNIQDPQLYTAMHNGAKRIDASMKDIFVKEKGDIKTLGSDGSKITTFSDLSGGVVYNDEGSVAKYITLEKGQSINTAYLNTNTSLALLGMDNNKAAVYELKLQGAPSILSGHQGLIRAAAFTADGHTIATGGRDSAVIIWKDYAMWRQINFSARIKALEFGLNADQLYIGCEDGYSYIYNFSNEKRQSLSASPGARVQAIHTSKKNRMVAVGFSNGKLQVLRENGSMLKTINESGSIECFAFDDKNDLLIVATSKLIHIYKLSDLSQKPVEINGVNSPIKALDIFDGEFIYISCADHSIRRFPISTEYFEKIFMNNLQRNFSTSEWNTYIGADVPFDNMTIKRK
jgi:energy-coupling factor transporter ATP-binding protein EcfA2